MIHIFTWIKNKWQQLLNAIEKRKKKRKRDSIKKKKEKAKKRQEKIMSASTPSFISSGNVNVINVDKPTNVLDVDLIDNNLNTKDKKKLRQFTKIIISMILSSGIIWITWSYILATIALLKFESFQPLEALSAKVCAVVIASVISYSFKSFVETFSEKKNELDLIKYNTEHSNEYDDFTPGTVTELKNNNELTSESNDDAVG